MNIIMFTIVLYLIALVTPVVDGLNVNTNSHEATKDQAKYRSQDEDGDSSDNDDDVDDDRFENNEKGSKLRHRRSPNETDLSQRGNGGATYIRWGRTVCSQDPYTELVYTGLAGGSLSTHDGAATELLCLPHGPIWNQFNSGLNNYGGFIYGVEYRYSFHGFIKDNLEATSLSGNNVPCAVCRSNLRSSVIMVPAWNRCHNGWNLEYHGYLMSGHHSHKSATQYTCVDESPEAVPGGYTSDVGRFLYPVEAVCGSLPCPKYVAGKEFTCAVCTK